MADFYSANQDSRSTSPSLTYDPKTQKWVPVSAPSTSGNLTPASNSSAPSNATTQTDSQSKADKEYIENTYNTLVGDLQVIPCKKTLNLKVNDTITLEGFGSFLSGDYFISAINRSITAEDGYSMSLTVIKTGFGNSMKASANKETTATRKEPVTPVSPTYKIGDKVMIVAANATYSNASEGVKVPAWVKQKVLTVDGISSDGTRVRLMPIFSWTYVKNLKKV